MPEYPETPDNVADDMDIFDVDRHGEAGSPAITPSRVMGGLSNLIHNAISREFDGWSLNTSRTITIRKMFGDKRFMIIITPNVIFDNEAVAFINIKYGFWNQIQPDITVPYNSYHMNEVADKCVETIRSLWDKAGRGEI